MRRMDAVVVTCEHGGNQVPEAFKALFAPHGALLSTHRGWDPGALELAKAVVHELRCKFFCSVVTRLLVDLNRSLGSRTLFSEISSSLDSSTRRQILDRYYHPMRRRAEQAISRYVVAGMAVLHLSIHTFTPVRRGLRRQTDLGLLYDPAHADDRVFCDEWHEALRRRLPRLRVRRNYPYKGTQDGFTTRLRQALPADQYMGIELEVNQKYPRRGGRHWEHMKEGIIHSLRDLAIPNSA